MDANRKTAYYTLMDVELKKSYSNISLNHHIICGKPDSPAFVRELVYGVLENKLLLDNIIDHFVANGIEKIKASDLIILRMGVYQIGHMDSVPEYAAVNESVNLAKKFSKGREGFINGVLRSYIKNPYAAKLPDRNVDEIKYLSIKYSYEPWIIELWMDQFNTDFVEEMLAAGNKTPELVIRVNTLKISREDLAKRLMAKDIEVEYSKLCEKALKVKGSRLLDGILYKSGLYSIQDESSMIAISKLDPQPGEFIIDVCAAPGGKTLAIAEKMGNHGRILAQDIYKRKLNVVLSEAERLDLNIVEIRTWDATRVDSALAEKADRVIVDAPCSGLGVIRRKPEIKYKKESSEIDSLPRKQIEILSASSNYVKPGGILLYST
ncbi:MAG: 16S rRNA (cytosine(967)-C(5))-methyltransferase RsmB, partial [Peptostreptococcaceae bacterium]|nr:16S rRNA (cytosine(967)-C(5))-methyltransferase RsmB [Peptostreptococcaceae bacterium]